MEAIPLNVLQRASAITGRLVMTLFIEQIYLNSMEKENTVNWELIILITRNNQLHLVESIPLIEMVLTLHPGFSHRTFYISDVKKGLNFGNMVFFCLCQPDRLVYINPRCTVCLFTPRCVLEKTFIKTRSDMEKERMKIESFRKGVWFYLAMENYSFCALMLHQLFECCFRFAELVLAGKEKVSHNLRNHHRDLLRFLPGLKELFNQSDQREMELVKRLDEAYLAVRYENDYVIGKEELLWLIEKSAWLEDQVNFHTEMALLQFRERYDALEDVDGYDCSLYAGKEAIT